MQALQNKPITICGDGSQTRSFCYVDDLIEAFIRLMNTPDDFTGPVNTGNPGEFTIMALAEKVIDMTNSKSEISFNPLYEGGAVYSEIDLFLRDYGFGLYDMYKPKYNQRGLIMWANAIFVNAERLGL